MLDTIANYIFMFFFFSAVGWTVECTYRSLGEKRVINSGFNHGPICPIYGTGMLVLNVCLLPLSQPAEKRFWLVILLGMVLADTVEYLTSYLMEKLFHARWWDYSDKPFNLNGRIYLNGFLAFGAASALLVDRIDPALRKRMNTVPPMIIELTAGAAWLAFAADSVITLAGVTGLEEKLQAAEETLEAELEKLPVAEHAHAAYEALQRLNAQQRRMLSAFPKLHLLSDNDRLTAIRRQFHNLSQRRESDSSLF